MNKPIRKQLALATTALLGTVAGNNAQAENSVDSNIRYSQLHYAELNRITVNKTQLKFAGNIKETLSFSSSVLYDTMSGATPNGRIFTDNADTGAIPITTASGFSFTTGTSTSELANQTGLTPFEDDRIAFSGSITKQANRLLNLTGGASLSLEQDYRSYGINGLISRDSPQRHTTVNFGAALNADKVKPSSGIQAGFGRTWCTDNVALRPTQIDCDNDPLVYEPADKYTFSLLFGFNNVINRNTISQFNLTTNYANGYLTDPYKLVSVLNDGSAEEEVAVFHEQRPRKRLSYSLFWKMVKDLNKKSLHLSNRFFWDDWGIRSNTTDLRLHWQIMPRTYAIPHLRFSAQTAADFYRDYFNKSELDTELPDYASADHRLSRQDTYTAGIKLTRRVDTSLEISARAEYLYQNYATTLMPNMHALIVQFIISSKL